MHIDREAGWYLEPRSEKSLALPQIERFLSRPTCSMVCIQSKIYRLCKSVLTYNDRDKSFILCRCSHIPSANILFILDFQPQGNSFKWPIEVVLWQLSGSKGKSEKAISSYLEVQNQWHFTPAKHVGLQAVKLHDIIGPLHTLLGRAFVCMAG